MENSNQPQTTFDNACSVARTKIKEVGNLVLSLKKDAIAGQFLPPADKEEMISNVTLAYRHLEDAAMRIGKAIQAFEGGKSIYDSNDAKRAASATHDERSNSTTITPNN